MNKIAKYIMLMMITLVVISMGAVACSKDKGNEPDPTQDRTPGTVSPIGYWRYQYTSSEEQEISVYNIREGNDLWTYSWGRWEGHVGTDMEMHKYYFDRNNDYLVFYYTEDSQDGEWAWSLHKVLDLGENVMTVAFMLDSDDNGPHVYGPFNTVKCQEIIDYHRGKPFDSSEIMTLKRISQDEFVNWWNSVS